MKTRLIIGFLFFPITCLVAQNSRIDSLLILTESSSDEKKIDIYFQLADVSYDSSAYYDFINYSKKAGALSRKIGDIKKTIKAENDIAIGYHRMDQYDSALVYYTKVLDNVTAKNDSVWIAKIMRNIGISYHKQGSLGKAKKNYELSMEIAEQMGDTNLILSGLISLGSYYSDVGEYEAGVKEYLRALEIAEKKKIPRAQSSLLMNLGNIYGKMGNNNKALDYQKASYEILYMLKDMQGIAYTLNNIGIIYKNMGENDSALHYYNRSMIIKRKIGSGYGIATGLVNIGILLSEQGKTDEAISCFDEGLPIADNYDLQQTKIDLLNSKAVALVGKGFYNQAKECYLTGLEIAEEKGFREKIRDIYEGMAALYNKEGNNVNAYNYLKLYIALKDSILNESNQKAIVEMQTRFDTEKVEKENEILTKNAEIQSLKLKKQQTQFWLLGAAICFILLLAVLAFVLYRSRQRNIRTQLEKQNMETEQRMLRSQMNPHFIFNSMSSIQGYITRKDNFTAMTYLSNFAELMRGILENSRKAMISMEEEVNTLNLYIELERLRLKNAFDFSIKIDPELDPEIIYVPPMLIQPFVENAIKHGLKNMNGDGILNIDFKMEKDLIKCSVTDNGIGRDMAGKNKPEGHQSLGMQVTQERLDMLKQEKKVNCHYIIDDLRDVNGKASGTRVDVAIPFEEE